MKIGQFSFNLRLVFQSERPRAPWPCKRLKGPQRAFMVSKLRSWIMDKRSSSLDYCGSPILLNAGFPQISPKQSIDKTNLSLWLLKYGGAP